MALDFAALFPGSASCLLRGWMRAFSSSGASIAIEKFNNENILHPYVGDESDMADCDLCTRARPTLYPIKAPVHNLTYPEGAYKGVCDICLEHLEKGWQERFGTKPENKK